MSSYVVSTLENLIENIDQQLVVILYNKVSKNAIFWKYYIWQNVQNLN